MQGGKSTQHSNNMRSGSTGGWVLSLARPQSQAAPARALTQQQQALQVPPCKPTHTHLAPTFHPG